MNTDNTAAENPHIILKASFLIVLSAVLYGFMGYLGMNVLQENMHTDTMLFWRFIIAGCWVSLFILKNRAKKQMIIRIDKRTFFWVFFLGAAAYSGSSLFYFMASRYTGTGLAMIIFFSYPIIVALISWIVYQQRLNGSTLVALLAMLGGLYLLQDSSTQKFSLLGILFALISAVFYALYMVFSKRFSSKSMDTNIVTTIVCFGCASIFLLTALITRHFVFPASLASWGYLLALGVLVTALPIQLMLRGLKYVSSVRASIISVLEPIITMIVGIVLLQESVSYPQVLGASIMLGSALSIQFQKRL